MTEFRTIPRPPKSKPGPRLKPVYVALLTTLQTGQAIEIPLGGLTLEGWRSRLAFWAKYHGYQAHVTSGAPGTGTVAAWITPREVSP